MRGCAQGGCRRPPTDQAAGRRWQARGRRLITDCVLRRRKGEGVGERVSLRPATQPLPHATSAQLAMGLAVRVRIGVHDRDHSIAPICTRRRGRPRGPTFCVRCSVRPKRHMGGTPRLSEGSHHPAPATQALKPQPERVLDVNQLGDLGDNVCQRLVCGAQSGSRGK